MDSTGSRSRNLKFVALPLIENDKRIEPWTYYKSSQVKSNMVCAGVKKEGGEDFCFGSQGGPLIVSKNSVDHSAVIHGITSWGGFANPRAPGVYTRVSKFINWINQHMKKSSSCSILSFAVIFDNVPHPCIDFSI